MRPRKGSTAEELVKVAERLIAEDGQAGPSLREIGLRAGSANKNVVQYHFGDRDGLIQAIFERRLPELDHRRAEMLAAFGADGRSVPLRQLLEILFRPIAECKESDGKRTFAGFLRKNSIYRREPRIDAHRHLAPFTGYVTELVRAALKAVPPALLSQRLHTCTLLFLDAFAEVDAGISIFSEAEAMDEVLTLCLAILEAPFPADWQPKT